MPRSLSDLDRHLFTRVALSRLRGAHPLLPRVSRAADHGLLWFGTAAALGSSGRHTARRAALRGLGSLAIASAITNSIAKPSTRRARPVIDAVPVVRRLTRQPRTTSFPSGHSASAAAFAAGVAIETPRLGAAVVPIAAAVAASRVYVGVHYPGDVLAGIAIGTGAAFLTRWWWPAKPDGPAAADPPRVPAPALRDGAGLTIVVNHEAGLSRGIGRNLSFTEDRLGALLPAAEVARTSPGQGLAEALDQAADTAARRGGALGVCGGDGTVNAAAAAALRHDIPLAVFPGGTFNHFARDLGIETLSQVARAVRAGDAVTVDVGRASTPDPGKWRIFLNTFSVGAYPELVRTRERLESRIGKVPALAAGLVRVLAIARPVVVGVNARSRRLWLLFVGNCEYQPAGFAPTNRVRLDDGLLDVRAVDGDAALARTRLLCAALLGTLHRSRVVVAAPMRELRLDQVAGPPHFAFDGEVAEPGERQLTVETLTRALTVYRPGCPGGDGDERLRHA